MKIALVHKRLDLRGGTERVFNQTAIELRNRGHDVHLFCQKFSITPPAGVVLHRVPGLSRPRTLRLLTFGIFAPLFIRRFNCDMVVSFDRLIKQDLFRSGGGPHKIFIEKMQRHGGTWRRLWYRLNPYHRLALAIERRQLSPRGSRAIVAVCEQTKRELIQSYGVAESKILVIHNGVDHERFHPRHRHGAGQRIRRELGIEDGSHVVLFVGSGFRRKGLDRLLQLWKEEALPNTYLLVVGNDARLPAYKAAWSHTSYVIFTGPKVNVEEYYGAADLLALPSIQESFGNVVVEAFAAGLPVVTVPGVGAMDKVEGDLRAGILEDPDDAAELQAKISWLLEPVRWPSLSRQARRIAEQTTWEGYCEKFEQALFALRDQREETPLKAAVVAARSLHSNQSH